MKAVRIFLFSIGSLLIILSTYNFSVTISQIDRQINRFQTAIDNSKLEYYDFTKDMNDADLKQISIINCQNTRLLLENLKVIDDSSRKFLYTQTKLSIIDYMICITDGPAYKNTIRWNKMTIGELDKEREQMSQKLYDRFDKINKDLNDNFIKMTAEQDKKRIWNKKIITTQIIGLLLVFISNFLKEFQK